MYVDRLCLTVTLTVALYLGIKLGMAIEKMKGAKR
jgi:hypothetical protein